METHIEKNSGFLLKMVKLYIIKNSKVIHTNFHKNIRIMESLHAIAKSRKIHLNSLIFTKLLKRFPAFFETYSIWFQTLHGKLCFYQFKMSFESLKEISNHLKKKFEAFIFKDAINFAVSYHFNEKA